MQVVGGQPHISRSAQLYRDDTQNGYFSHAVPLAHVCTARDMVAMGVWLNCGKVIRHVQRIMRFATGAQPLVDRWPYAAAAQSLQVLDFLYIGALWYVTGDMTAPCVAALLSNAVDYHAMWTAVQTTGSGGSGGRGPRGSKHAQKKSSLRE